jgi:hypothetical protein
VAQSRTGGHRKLRVRMCGRLAEGALYELSKMSPEPPDRIPTTTGVTSNLALGGTAIHLTKQ